MCAGIVGLFLAPGFGLSVGPAPGFVAVGIEIVVAIVGFVWMWRRRDRPPDARTREREAKEADFFIIAWRGLGWVVLILVIVGAVAGGVSRRSISAFVAALVVLVFFGLASWMFGPTLALFVISLMEPPPVRRARQEVDDWYLLHGHDSPEPVRPT